jgi:putative DNA primase/helicase
MMPEMLRPWCEDAAERMQAPPDYVAVAIMAALGSLIGLKVGIRPKVLDDWTEHANVWGGGIGTPGIMKSPSFSEGLRPLKMLAAAARDAYKVKRASYEIDLLSAKVKSDNAKKAAAKALSKDRNADISYLLRLDEIKQPVCKRYIVTNASTEALGVILQQNPNGVLVDRDELLSLLERLDDEGQSEDRGFYLVGWAGNLPYTFDRIGRGLDMHIDSVCISMIGGTQPARISQYLEQIRRGARNNDGMIQRFGLMVWPDITPGWKNIDRKPNLDARNKAFRVFKAVDDLDWRAVGAKWDRLGKDPDGETVGTPYLRFATDAQERFAGWHQELEERLRSGTLDPMMESHLAKYRKLVPALALMIHLADATGDDGKVRKAPQVTDAAVEKALKWSAYLETHAARMYDSISIASTDAAKAIVAKIRSGQLKKGGFGSREILRSQWSLLKDRGTVHAALQLLVDHDWLFITKMEKTGGRPSTIYTPNPKILKGRS